MKRENRDGPKVRRRGKKSGFKQTAPKTLITPGETFRRGNRTPQPGPYGYRESRSRGLGSPWQGGPGQKTHSRERKFAPPNTAGSRVRGWPRRQRHRPHSRPGCGDPDPTKGNEPLVGKDKKELSPRSATEAVSPAPTRLRTPAHPAPAETRALPLAPPLPHPRAGASPRTAPAPAVSSPETSLRRRRGALWGLESSRRALCAAAARPGTATPTMPRARPRATPPPYRLSVPLRLHFPTGVADLPPSLLRHEPNWASGRGAGRVPARCRCRCRRRPPPAVTLPLLPPRELHR